jgi:hypothetical protein
MFVAIIILTIFDFFIARWFSSYLSGTGLYIANSFLQVGFLLIIALFTPSKK